MRNQKSLIVLAILLCLFFIGNTVYYTLKKHSFLQKQSANQTQSEDQQSSQSGESSSNNQPQQDSAGQSSAANPANAQVSEVEFRDMVSSILEKEGYTLHQPLPSNSPYLPAAVELRDVNKDGKEEAIVTLPNGRTTETIGVNIYGLNDQGQVVVLGEKLGCSNIKQNIPNIKRFSSTKIGKSQLLDNGVSVECDYFVVEDPECCPSIVYKEYYEWDGHKFVFTTDERTDSSNKK